MTIPSTSRKAGPLLGTGAQTAWPFTFKVFAASDIAVTIADSLGIETALVLDTDYSVTLNANQETSPGGTVTYPISGTPLAVGSKLSIIGDLDYDQPLDLPSGGNFSPLALENQLDRMTMQLQQLEERLSRALLVPVNSTADVQLPNPEANELIGWDSTGDNLANYALSELATGIAYGTMRFDTFVGDGTTTQFALTEDPAALANLDVSLAGVTQVPGTDYTLTSATLVFTTAPVNGVAILARYGRALPIVGPTDSSAVTHVATGAGAVATTVQAKLRESVSVFDFMTAAQIADVQAGTRALNVTAAVQAVFDYAKLATDRELQIDIPAGDYAVNTLSIYRCHNVVFNVMGSAFFTGVSASETKLLSVNGADGDFTRRMVVNGILRLQCIGGTAYQYGAYLKGVTDSHLFLSVSGAYSVAAIYMDVCFNNLGELTASNSTANKHVILCDQNNVNINNFRVRCSGIGNSSGQIGLEAAGNGNEWYGDISTCQYGVKLFAATGSTFLFYMEQVKAPVTCGGISRGITFQGGYYEILSSSTCFDFSAGTVQGLHMAGMRMVGVGGGSARQLFNWGTACYHVTLEAYDAAAYDTESTGTLRGSTGGIADQLIGAVRHRSNGVASFLGGSSKVFISQTVSGAGTVTLDASLGDARSLTVQTAGAVVIGAPTNPTSGQEMTIEIRNTSGGALTLTWNAIFKLAAWTSPATTFGRSITFCFDGTNWKEIGRVSADVPN